MTIQVLNQNSIVIVSQTNNHVIISDNKGDIGLTPWANLVSWASGQAYQSIAPASIVVYNNSSYLCTTSHTSSGTFDPTKWQLISGGSVSQVNTGAGMIGGPITGSGTVSVNPGQGLIADLSGVYVNTAYIATLDANNSFYLGGIAANQYSVLYANNVYSGVNQFQANVVCNGDIVYQYTEHSSNTKTLVAGSQTFDQWDRFKYRAAQYQVSIGYSNQHIIGILHTFHDGGAVYCKLDIGANNTSNTLVTFSGGYSGVLVDIQANAVNPGTKVVYNRSLFEI